MSVERQFTGEVDRGERFEFGKNWARFLKTVNAERIQLAETSLRRMLGVERLDGNSFIDIGSGSGLFSLAARRLGAKVHSFDYDPNSVACTQELRRRYFPDDGEWVVERGSVLDPAYLARLGTHDIVYSWGVLHHTGAMWQALENIKPLAKLGGKLFIAIYNDVGEVSERWAQVKHRYNQLPRTLKLPYALSIIGREESRTLSSYLRRFDLPAYLRIWTEYARNSTRGMSKWHDWIDWIGGHPYEYASVEACVDFFSRDGFRLAAIEDRSGGYGCNEFVFVREAPFGTNIDQVIPTSRWISRRLGRKIGAVRSSERGWQVDCSELPSSAPGESYFVLSHDSLLGQVEVTAEGELLLAPDAIVRDPQAANRIISARHVALRPPFAKIKANSWSAPLPDLAPFADDVSGRSPLSLFEDRQQLPRPHSLHAEIAKYGKGRFSHWQDGLYFSTSDNSDPNKNGRSYEILYSVEPKKA